MNNIFNSKLPTISNEHTTKTIDYNKLVDFDLITFNDLTSREFAKVSTVGNESFKVTLKERLDKRGEVKVSKRVDFLMNIITTLANKMAIIDQFALYKAQKNALAIKNYLEPWQVAEFEEKGLLKPFTLNEIATACSVLLLQYNFPCEIRNRNRIVTIKPFSQREGQFMVKVLSIEDQNSIQFEKTARLDEIDSLIRIGYDRDTATKKVDGKEMADFAKLLDRRIQAVASKHNK